MVRSGAVSRRMAAASSARACYMAPGEPPGRASPPVRPTPPRPARCAAPAPRRGRRGCGPACPAPRRAAQRPPRWAQCPGPSMYSIALSTTAPAWLRSSGATPCGSSCIPCLLSCPPDRQAGRPGKPLVTASNRASRRFCVFLQRLNPWCLGVPAARCARSRRVLEATHLAEPGFQRLRAADRVHEVAPDDEVEVRAVFREGIAPRQAERLAALPPAMLADGDRADRGRRSARPARGPARAGSRSPPSPPRRCREWQRPAGGARPRPPARCAAGTAGCAAGSRRTACAWRWSAPAETARPIRAAKPGPSAAR